MRILCIGDIVGKPGRKAVQHLLGPYVREQGVDLVVANAENVAGGSGLTGPLYQKLRRFGVDVVTLGDHVYRRREVYPLLAEEERIVRPANLAPEAAGRTFTVIPTAAGPVAVFCLLGRLYMKPPADCPFHAADAVLAQLGPEVKVIVVDMHAEATSEKIAMGRYLAPRASVVFGTHTHVTTADETILAGHTAYITDVGMTGPHDSVLGRDSRAVIAAMTSSMPHPFDVAEHDARLCGALVEIDSSSGAALSIQRVRLDLPDGIE